MMNFAIKPEGTFRFDTCTARTEYGTDTQKTNAEGIPQWTVSVIYRGAEDARSELMNVTVSQKDNPSDSIEEFAPVDFDDMHIMSGDNNGRTWVSLSAAGVHPKGAARVQAQNAQPTANKEAK